MAASTLLADAKVNAEASRSKAVDTVAIHKAKAHSAQVLSQAKAQEAEASARAKAAEQESKAAATLAISQAKVAENQSKQALLQEQRKNDFVSGLLAKKQAREDASPANVSSRLAGLFSPSA